MLVDVTPVLRRALGQEKTPAAGWQTRERVGNELNSADTLTYDENERGTHPPTIPQVPRRVNFILESGRTLGSPSKPST